MIKTITMLNRKKSLPADRQGFVPVGLLALLLAVVGLATAIFVINQNTDLTNFAQQPNVTIGGGQAHTPVGEALQVTEFGTIVKVSPDKYDLQTNDGRVYHLVTNFGAGSTTVTPTPTPCLPSSLPPCAQSSNPRINLAKYIGQTVLVEGAMKMTQPSCLTATPPCKLPTRGWWPLPSGLDFKIKNISPVTLVADGVQLTDILERASGSFAGENVYVLKNLLACTPATFPCPLVKGPPGGGGTRGERKIYFRSSYKDYGYLVQNQTTIMGTAYIIGSSLDGDILVNDRNYPAPAVTPNPKTCVSDADCTVCPPSNQKRPCILGTCAQGKCIVVLPSLTPTPAPSPVSGSCTKDADCNPCRPPRECAQSAGIYRCFNNTCVNDSEQPQ